MNEQKRYVLRFALNGALVDDGDCAYDTLEETQQALEDIFNGDLFEPCDFEIYDRQLEVVL